MPDQQYTDAQLSDGRTLRFQGQLGPDEVRQKVHSFRTNEGARQIQSNPPGVPSPPRLKDMIAKDDSDATLAGVPGGSPSVPPASDTAGNVALGGIGAAATAMYGPQALRLAKPLILPALGSYAINKARDLPVVGPVINKIPMAEMLPWMGSGKGKSAEAIEGSQARPRLIEAMGGKVPETITDRPSGRLVLSPEEAQAEAGQMRLAKKVASQRGMQYAAGQRPSNPGAQ